MKISRAKCRFHLVHVMGNFYRLLIFFHLKFSRFVFYCYICPVKPIKTKQLWHRLSSTQQQLQPSMRSSTTSQTRITRFLESLRPLPSVEQRTYSILANLIEASMRMMIATSHTGIMLMARLSLIIGQLPLRVLTLISM